jgi:hypothetical protein
MGPVPTTTVIELYEDQLAQLLGAEAAARADSFAVQAVLDQDVLSYLPTGDTPEAIREWHRRQAEKLPSYRLNDLKEAARILRLLEAHDPRRRDAIKQRFLIQLQSSRNEIERELAVHTARYALDYRVHAMWHHSGPDNTYYWADVHYTKLVRVYEPDLAMAPGMHRLAGHWSWIPAEPVALLLLRLNWRDSRIHYDLPSAKESSLERTLKVVQTISEFVLFVTGIADAVAIAELLGVLAGAGARALGEGVVRSLALRRGAREAATSLAGRAETAGLRTLPELGSATGDTARLTTRAIGPAERGLPPRPSVLGDPLTAERATVAAPVATPSGAAAGGLTDPGFAAARLSLEQVLRNPAVGIDELGSIGAARTRESFRRRLLRLVRDPSHPLNFLVRGGRLRPSTVKGITELDWLEAPEIIEAGHAQSAKALSGSGVQDRFMVMSAYENRLLSSTVEHPSLGGSIDTPWALEIKGVPVQAKTAMDWVAKGLLEPSELAAARRVIYR